jgi:hydrogenase-4 component E
MNSFLIILMGSTMLYVFATTRIEGYIKTIAFQGIILGLLVLADLTVHALPELIFLLVETVVFKAVVIPLILMNALRKSGMKREIEPYVPMFFSFLVATIIMAAGFIIAYWASDRIGNAQTLYFGISISIIILSLFLILTRKKIITHILGYIMMENGIFLLALSVASEIPFIVSLGVFLDVFVGIYLFVLFLGKIQKAYDEDHIDALQNLKD